jgi:hygromycin-B 7''-O-kinase
MHPLSALDDLNSYCRLFTDAVFWTPYVREVFLHHSLPCQSIRLGVPGTYPVFLVDHDYVIKFFGCLFDGEKSFAAEQEAGRLVGRDPLIRTAQVLAEGKLVDFEQANGRLGDRDWPWPYLIFQYISGISLGEVFNQVSKEDRLRAAHELGDTVQRIHALPLAGSVVFPASHEPYLRFLEQQRAGVVERHREWSSLPGHLIKQIDAFLPTVDSLVDCARPPHLIHADLTRDHLLGRFANGRWTTLAIIDFGDAMTGDLLYELCALHLDLFGSDRRLLSVFLDAYGLPEEKRVDLPCKALATALLHQFNVSAAVPRDLLYANSLDQLADLLFAA